MLSNPPFGVEWKKVEKAERDEMGRVMLGQKDKQKRKPQPDTALCDTENVPLVAAVRVKPFSWT